MVEENTGSTTTPEPSKQTQKQTFEAAYPELDTIVESHRNAWTYTSMVEWADIRSILIIRLWQKYHLYDPAKGPLEHWARRVIKNQLLNCNRDLGLQRLQRPCVGGGKTNGKACVYNTGGNGCSYTPSKTQCSECVLYKEWQKKRAHQWNLKSTVALENHAQEVYSIPSETSDIEGTKAWLDEEMLKELTRWEGRVYRMLFVRHMSPAATSKALAKAATSRKRPLGPSEQTSYQWVLAQQRRFESMMMEILRRGGYI